MGLRRQRIKVQIRGAQIPSNDSYLSYFEAAMDVAQQRIWTFYEAVLKIEMVIHKGAVSESKFDVLVKSIQMAKIKVPYARRSDFSDKKSYM